MAQVFLFDGESSRIKCQNTSSFTMTEVYSRWKDWVLTSDNAKFLRAFRFVGGDPTVSGRSLGITYFLMNNWRIVPFTGSLDYDLDVEGNLFLDEATNSVSASNPYEFPGVLVRQSVSNLTDAQVLESDINKRLDYTNDTVFLDPIGGVSGSLHPVGTSASPVNNEAQALQLMGTYGLQHVVVQGHYTLSKNWDGKEIIGETQMVNLTIDSASLNNTKISNISLTGYIDSTRFMVERSLVYDLTYQNGWFDTCGLSGSLCMINTQPNATFFSCFSMVPGTGSPLLDFAGSSNSLVNIRMYSGGIRFKNYASSTNISTVEFTAGRMNIDPTCSDGLLSVRGTAYLNGTGSGVNLETGSLFNPVFFSRKIDDMATKTKDIHLVHGLDPTAPMYVTKTQRTAGDVSQTFVTGSGDVTVTRL
jgi:hypothetical protein